MTGMPQRQALTLDEVRDRFSDLLRRVEDRGESFAIARNGREIAELGPVASRPATLGSLREALRRAPQADEGFGRELEMIRSQQPKLPEDPWAS